MGSKFYIKEKKRVLSGPLSLLLLCKNWAHQQFPYILLSIDEFLGEHVRAFKILACLFLQYEPVFFGIESISELNFL